MRHISIGMLVVLSLACQQTKELPSHPSEYSGIGVELKRTGNGFKVIRVFDGGPAKKAGLRAGDLLLEVDGYDISDESLGNVVARLRGPQGTQVLLTVKRMGSPKLIIPITRGVLVKASATTYKGPEK